ncbi:MAG: TatD DNase family protein [Verrucomicrobiales bacterium]|jgi:TatD DNase family protein
MLYDAHCHLQDLRLARAGFEPAALRETGLKRAVVNGTRPEDWPAVASLAAAFPDFVQPSFGLHPWWANDRPPVAWRSKLHQQLLDHPKAGIGEIGLDRWIDDFDMLAQEEAFLWQLEMAAEFDKPASIHCLKAWGRLLELLKANQLPERGFLLHSFGGPAEMVKPLADLGAYFSFCGYFLHERKASVREAFKIVPPDRLLIETDAPDQPLPEELDEYRLTDFENGERLNDPHSLDAIYEGLADVLGRPVDDLAGQIEANFLRFFD